MSRAAVKTLNRGFSFSPANVDGCNCNVVASVSAGERLKEDVPHHVHCNVLTMAL